MADDDKNPVLLRIYLRGGQTIERVVTDWKVRQSNETGELLEFGRIGLGDGERMPFIRLDAIDAITRHPINGEVPA